MSEREPHEWQAYIQFGEHTLELPKERTTIFLHTNPEHYGYDHIFLVASTDADEEETGNCFFREKVGNFNELVTGMLEHGYTLLKKENVSDFDRNVYKSYFGREPVPAEVELQELTDRQIHRVNYLKWLLEHDNLTATDFNGEGDMFL